MSFQIVNPESLDRAVGFSHGMLAVEGGRLLFVAGQTARDAGGRIAGNGFVAQFERALANVLEVVRAAGGEPRHIGRLTLYVTDRRAYLESLRPVGEVYRRLMGRHYPAMALLEVKGLFDDDSLVEIEATAVIP